jgi:hypothetical protein
MASPITKRIARRGNNQKPSYPEISSDLKEIEARRQ